MGLHTSRRARPRSTHPELFRLSNGNNSRRRQARQMATAKTRSISTNTIMDHRSIIITTMGITTQDHQRRLFNRHKVMIHMATRLPISRDKLRGRHRNNLVVMAAM